MKFCQRLIAALFFSVISLPVAVNLAGFDGGDPGAENRTLAPRPTFDGSLESAAAYATGFSAWFDDHFGMRSALVRWNAEGHLRVLRVSPTTDVVKGRDGWFFYGSDSSVEDFANQSPLTSEGVQAWRDTLTRAAAWLVARHVAYVFTIAPDKGAVYPDEMPATLVRLHDTSRTDQVFAALAGGPVAAVDVRQALAAASRRERTYQQTDTHWNDRGALVAYQAIIGAIRQQLPAVPPAWSRDDFEPVDRTVEGMDLAGMMGLKRALRETDLVLVARRPRQARVVEPPGAAPTDQEGRLVTEIPGSPLPRALIFRDSFAARLAPFLSEHFSRAVYVWQNDFDPDVVQQEHPDVVIQEIVGRHLYNFIPSPELVPD